MAWSKDNGSQSAVNAAQYVDGKKPLIEKAIVDAGIAKPLAESAKTESEQASVTAEQADAKATDALAKASTAKTVSETVRGEFDLVVAEAGSNNPEVVQARGGEVNLKARLDKTTAQLAETEADLLQRAVNVRQPPFNAKGNGSLGDRDIIWEAVQYCNQNQRPLYFPKGSYLIDKTIDFSTLPFIEDTTNPDYQYRITLIGESVNNVTFLGEIGLEKMLTYSNMNGLRSFTLKNIKVRSKDPWNNLTVRAPLKAFEFLNSPFCEFEDIDFLGIDFGFHLASAWGSSFKNIKGSRYNKGIFIDGTNPGNPDDFGFADYCLLDKIVLGGANEYGLKILGSRATKISSFDSEGGHTGNAIYLQGCHNVEIDTLYFENYIDASPIKVIGNPIINSVSDFSTNIKIKNAHIYNPQTPVVSLGKGVDGLVIGNTRFLFDYDKINGNSGLNPITSQTAFIMSMGVALDGGIGNYIKNISILDNGVYNPEIYHHAFAAGWSTTFVNNGKSFARGATFAYYGASFRKGITVIQLDKTLDYDSFLVEEEGSYGTLTGVTGTINIGSNLAALSDVTNIIPGTYISIGGVSRVKVLSKNPITKQIVIGKNATETVTNGVVSYANPILRYNFKSRSGGTAGRPTDYVRGEQYYDSNLNKPIWWDGASWNDKMSKFVSVPASATALGNIGDWSADASYMYVCHATNTWKRIAITTW